MFTFVITCIVSQWKDVARKPCSYYMKCNWNEIQYLSSDNLKWFKMKQPFVKKQTSTLYVYLHQMLVVM